jgi:hypothetical protein
MPPHKPICPKCGGPRIPQQKCPACTRNYMRQYHQVNGAASRDRAKTFHAEMRGKALAAYGGECACCGESRREFLAIDHIGGGGGDHRRSLFGKRNAGGHVFYRWLHQQGYPLGFRVLCHNCNQSMGLYGYCPHEVERGTSLDSGLSWIEQDQPGNNQLTLDLTRRAMVNRAIAAGAVVVGAREIVATNGVGDG